MPEAHIETYLLVAGIELDVVITVSGDYTEQGIGAYEFWGSRGVDRTWGWGEEVEFTGVLYDPGDIPAALRCRQPGLSRKRFLKKMRRVRQLVAALIEDTARLWVAENGSVCNEALSSQNELFPERTSHHHGRYAYA